MTFVLSPRHRSSLLYSIVCDSTFLHGLKHLEIIPQDKAAVAVAKSAVKKKAPAKKHSDSGQDPEPSDLDTAQAIVRSLNIKDLKKLQYALQPINDVVCPSCATHC